MTFALPVTRHDRSHVALIAQLVENCTGNAKVVGSNPVQSLNFFRLFFQLCYGCIRSFHSLTIVFDYVYKHLDVRQKSSTTSRFFNSLVGVR